uniref:Uncharacterized protein n=1 Tax=Kalanchoe fedtschenkoi TaxID=63787 RepID=A0A7N0VJY9_KALFE
MASLSSSCNVGKRIHLLALPYPGRGHINPMLNLCKSLLARLPNLTITFILTEEWLGFLRSDPEPPPGIRYLTIPNVIPSERVRSRDMRSFLSAVMTEMEGPCEEVINQMEQPVDVIIADCFLVWAVEVGRRRGIPVSLLWTMSATTFAMFHHFDLLKKHGHFPIDLQAMADVRVDY